MLDKYNVIDLLQLAIFALRTKLLFKKARIIRFPFRIRGRRFVSIDSGFTSGYNCRFDAFNFNGKKNILISIGKNVQINDNVHIGAIERIEIQDNVLIASKVFITDHNHGSYSGAIQDSPLSNPSSRPLYSKPVKIESNVWIGEFVSILPGVIIGQGSIIGAGSVVVKNIPSYSIAVGAPAKVVKRFDFLTNEWILVK